MSAHGRPRTSSTTIGTTLKPHSCSRAILIRSCLSAAGVACHCMLSYSATSLASGQAKSARHRSPHRSTISYCSSGGGSPPSMNTRRASLSIGDSARPSACSTSSRTRTIPRRPFCSHTASRRSSTVQAPTCKDASRTASARGRRSVRATSTAVQAGAVARRSPICTSGAPTRWCTTTSVVGRPARRTRRRQRSVDQPTIVHCRTDGNGPQSR
jgi:hypothetical protein